jgi:hypothetical protein
MSVTGGVLDRLWVNKNEKTGYYFPVAFMPIAYFIGIIHEARKARYYAGMAIALVILIGTSPVLLALNAAMFALSVAASLATLIFAGPVDLIRWLCSPKKDAAQPAAAPVVEQQNSQPDQFAYQQDSANAQMYEQILIYQTGDINPLQTTTGKVENYVPIELRTINNQFRGAGYIHVTTGKFYPYPTEQQPTPPTYEQHIQTNRS